MDNYKIYKLSHIPDLSLCKYSSLENKGVEGVLDNHIAFLRQINRTGIVYGLSYHLLYFYTPSNENNNDGLQIYIIISGKNELLKTASALMASSPLSDFFPFIEQNEFPDLVHFSACATLTKSESFLKSLTEETEYYIVRDWKLNEDARLYNMCKTMASLGKNVVYRVDLYPKEKSLDIRNSLNRPIALLRQKQEARNFGHDYDSKVVLDNYEELIEKFESSPHFNVGLFVFAETKDTAMAILDSAGAEALKKGKYTLSSYLSDFNWRSFLNETDKEIQDQRGQILLKTINGELTVCKKSAPQSLNYIPTLFTLEEIAPFFRFPALYDGEVIQIAKETVPKLFSNKESLYLGKDINNRDVYFPVELLPKHAFISGVPGSGKTNAMHHITSSLWLNHKIPFLVLEPAKKEYRALLNDERMKDLYLFSPNADMSFPLHINPFEMPKGLLIAEHIRSLCSVFEGAFPLDPPMPFLLDTAIEAVYREKGWIPEHRYTGNELDNNNELRKFPTMSMLYKRLEEELKSTDYSAEISGNLKSALQVRIGSLLRREMGDIFDVPYSTFEPEKWLEVPAVIELESMGEGPANFLTLMLCSLIRETLKVNPVYEGDLRHVIFIEEAHNLIGPESEAQAGSVANPKQAATAFIVKMLAEVRALKEGVVIADQLPTVMADEVLKNTGLKLGLRITSSDDRQLLGSTMSANSLQLEQMATFLPGETLTFYEGLLRPFAMRVSLWRNDLLAEERTAIATSKSDEQLRSHLCNNEAYRIINQRSVEIISSKISSDSVFADLIAFKNKFDKIRELKKELDNIEVKLLNEQEPLVLEELEQKHKSGRYGWDLLVTDFTNSKIITDIYTRLYNLYNTTERLITGRWKRFEPTKKSLLLSNELCLDIYLCMENLIEIIKTDDIQDFFYESNQEESVDLVIRYFNNGLDRWNKIGKRIDEILNTTKD